MHPTHSAVRFCDRLITMMLLLTFTILTCSSKQADLVGFVLTVAWLFLDDIAAFLASQYAVVAVALASISCLWDPRSR